MLLLMRLYLLLWREKKVRVLDWEIRVLHWEVLLE